MFATDSSAPPDPSIDPTPSGISPPPRRALLVLEDGRTFRGRAFGAVGETFGEAVFATAMSGYQELLTDPSYHRQVVIATAPHIGNTGWNDEDDESGQIWVAGYVVRDPARVSSNWRSRRSLDDELKAQGVVGMSDVDTRALTRHLRERGAMRVGISSVETDASALLERVKAQPPMSGAHLADEVSTSRVVRGRPDGDPSYRVVAVDLGIKSMTPARMAERGIEVHVVPSTATFDRDRRPPAGRGVLLQRPRRPGGRGRPGRGAASGPRRRHPVLRHLLRQPVVRSRAGPGHLQTRLRPPRHQPAGDGPDHPQGRGHRAQPRVRRRRRRRRSRSPTPYGTAEVSHVCLNDDVVEGLQLENADGRLTAFSVQYHPEAAAGPHDAAYLFDRFIDMMRDDADLEPAVEGREL